MSRGVVPGAYMAFQEMLSNPGTPNSRNGRIGRHDHRPFEARNSEASHLAAFRQRQNHRQRRKHERYMAAGDVDQRRRFALIRHVCHFQIEREVEELSCQVAARAHTGAAERQCLVVRFRERNKLAESFRRQ